MQNNYTLFLQEHNIHSSSMMCDYKWELNYQIEHDPHYGGETSGLLRLDKSDHSSVTNSSYIGQSTLHSSAKLTLHECMHVNFTCICKVNFTCICKVNFTCIRKVDFTCICKINFTFFTDETSLVYIRSTGDIYGAYWTMKHFI